MRFAKPPKILVIGVSTGGPNALASLVKDLPGNLPVPVLITQHMPPMFTRLLAERLDDRCPLRVEEAKDGQKLEPGHVWVAPGDYHLLLRRDALSVRIVLDQGPKENSCRPAVDPMFKSAVNLYGAHVLGVVLTGMGQDGLRGCEAIKDSHGQVVVQDETTSVVWGMPGYVAEAGLADRILPLDWIADEIARRVKNGRPMAAGRPAAVVHDRMKRR